MQLSDALDHLCGKLECFLRTRLRAFRAWIHHEWERRNWTQWLHCNEQELRHAVESVGADPDNVRRFLRQSR